MQDLVAVASGPKVRVLIADSDARMRRQLRELLDGQPDFDVVGEADSGALALQLARWLRPNLMLIDEHLSTRGPAFTAVLAAELPEVQLVLMTGSAGI